MEINFNIFISHDSKDEAIAIELKAFLENIFLNASVYVSGRDLKGGQTWIENIKLSLKSSQVIISIISKESINSNWIYFETGAGFTDDKSIPLLTDGLEFGDLTPPLSLLQARILSNSGIELLVSDISNKLNLRTPKILTGIEKLLEETNKFFALRNKENVEDKTVKFTTSDKPKRFVSASPIAATGVDPDIKELHTKTEQRAIELTIRSILSFKGKLDIPTENELRELRLAKLQDVALGYNIPYPSGAYLNIILAGMNLPPKDAKQWEKLNVSKQLNDANTVLDKFEKTI